MNINDLVMNSHKGAVRYGTITRKRIDKSGWAWFIVKWHDDEDYNKVVEQNVNVCGAADSRPYEYRTDMLQTVTTKKLTKVISVHKETSTSR